MREQGEGGREHALLARLRSGDPGAFEQLVIARQHRVHGVAMRMLGNAAEAEEEGLSYEEIAAALDLRSRLHRARTDLKDKQERFIA